jgi:predicted DNA-binding protein
MVVNLKPETESRLKQLSASTGRPADELVEDAMAGYLAELSEIRGTLDGRYDDIKSGRVKPVDGEAFFERLCQREAELLKQRPPK